jgi:hypothetical protein
VMCGDHRCRYVPFSYLEVTMGNTKRTEAIQRQYNRCSGFEDSCPQKYRL